ncbi:MAG: phage portal protein [Lachnospiraceae bacterium]|nr:phage portal protein [Lachnospiraceae bacterium]
MGWIKDKFKALTTPRKEFVYADMLNGYTPVFSKFGQDIYASDVVKQAVSCVVGEMQKLKPKHVIDLGNSDETVARNKEIQKILDYPNELMTKSDFLEKITWNLMLDCNSFIIPCYRTWKDKKGNEQRHYAALYPVNPSQVDFLEDSSGEMFVKFFFANGYNATVKYSEVIHIRRNFSLNEYMGGNANGQSDNEAILETLQLNKDLQKGLSGALKSSFAINGIVKVNGLLDREKQEKEAREFEEKLKKAESGVLVLDSKSEFTRLPRDTKLIDPDTLKFIDEKILRNYGVPIEIIKGKYTKEDYESFYQRTIEPLVSKYSEAFTRALFTKREKECGNYIKFYPEDLIFMTTDQKLEMVRLLGDCGSMYENEKRVAFGMPPLAELEGQRKASLNYIDAEKATEYQMKGVKANAGDKKE